MVNVSEIEILQIKQNKKNKDLAKHLNISVQALNRKKKGAIKWSIEDVMGMISFFEITDPIEKVRIFLS